MAKLGAQPEAIVNGAFEGRNAESIQRNFEKIFRRLGQLSGLPADPDKGDLAYFDGDAWVSLGIGTADQVLTVEDGLPAWVDVTDIPDGGADLLGLEAVNQWAFIPRNGAMAGYGVSDASVTGTRAETHQADSTYIDFITGSTAGNLAGFVTLAGDANIVHGSQDFTLIAFVHTRASLDAMRIMIGLTDTTFVNADDQGGTTDYVAFRYSTVAGDGGWVGMSRDGTTHSVTAVVATIAVDTAYKLKIRKVGSSVFFSVNGGTEVEKTTNLPQEIGLKFDCRISTTENVAKRLAVSRVWCKLGTGAGAL